jgi:hypothetical protein
MMPFARSTPAGTMTFSYEAETLLRIWIGCQSRSATFLIASAANLGVDRLIKMSGLAALI